VVAFEPMTKKAVRPSYMDATDVVETVSQQQELELLSEAIQSLPDRCRQVFTLRAVYGLSQREIASGSAFRKTRWRNKWAGPETLRRILRATRPAREAAMKIFSRELSRRATAIDERATTWLARRDRGLSPREQDEYLQWLREDDRHAARSRVRRRRCAA